MKKKRGRSPEDFAIMARMGRILRAKRKAFREEDRSRWTLEALAARIGITPQQIGNIERGKQWPGPDILRRLSLELQVTLDSLLGRECLPRPEQFGEGNTVSGSGNQ